MTYNSYIIDIHGKEWLFTCELSGNLEEVDCDPFGPDESNSIGYVANNIKFLDIIIYNNDFSKHSVAGIKMYIKSLATMPDLFSQRVINNLEQDAIKALEEHLKYEVSEL